MKKYLLLLLFFFLFQNIFALKVMTFNLWTGDERKLEKFYEILEKSEADIIIINEANDKDVFYALAEKLKFERVLNVHNKYNVGIMSRYPILSHKFHKLSELSKSLVEAQVVLPDAQIVNVFACHLVALDMPKRSKVRQAEIKAILSIVGEKKGLPTILAGDMNEESHLDKTMPKNSISRQLEGFGLVDSYRNYHICPEVAPGYTHNILLIPTKRIDYIYLSKDFKINGSETLNKSLFKNWPSDHAALVSDIQFELKIDSGKKLVEGTSEEGDSKIAKKKE